MRLVVQKLRKRYPGQVRDQEVIMDVLPNGHVYIGHNPETGNAVPITVHNGLTIRFVLPAGIITTREQARGLYRDLKYLLCVLVDGMGNRADSRGNREGILTLDACLARDCIQARLEKLHLERYDN